MIELIGSVFSFAFGLVELGFSLAWGMLECIFGVLGGIFSFLMALGGSLLTGGLVLLAVFRRRARREAKRHPDEEQSTRTYDVDGEEFTSFYDQFRTQA